VISATLPGIKDAGQVVGSSDIADGSSRAFVTGLNGMGMMDLNLLVDLPDEFILTDAIDVNNGALFPNLKSLPCCWLT
jgi:probable HAF family extracellular repeat protein